MRSGGLNHWIAGTRRSFDGPRVQVECTSLESSINYRRSSTTRSELIIIERRPFRLLDTSNDDWARELKHLKCGLGT
jgi:hypothetical protein